MSDLSHQEAFRLIYQRRLNEAERRALRMVGQPMASMRGYRS